MRLLHLGAARAIYRKRYVEVAPLVSGALIAHVERKTLRKEGYIKVE